MRSGGQATTPGKDGSAERIHIESFHSRLRDEFLERVEFEDVADARAKAFGYRGNTRGPASQLTGLRDAEHSLCEACDKKG